jgi:peptidoglycan hydrolase CwlO-like protein
MLLEDMNSKFDFLIEAVGQMRDEIKSLPAVDANVQEIKADIKIVKAAVVDTSSQVQQQDKRITRLESKII